MNSIVLTVFSITVSSRTKHVISEERFPLDFTWVVGKFHQQFTPVHPLIVHQAIKVIVVNPFKKILARILHSANTFIPKPKDQQ